MGFSAVTPRAKRCSEVIGKLSECKAIVDRLNRERFEIPAQVEKRDIIGYDGRKTWAIGKTSNSFMSPQSSPFSLFSISGIIFAVHVAPLQRQLRALAEAGVESGAFDYARYHALSLRWEIWGIIALLTPMGGLVLMVLKPPL